MLQERLAESPLDEHIILGDFNLHHLVWGGIEAKSDSNAKSLLAIVEQYGLHLLLKTGTITYDEAGHQSTINLIFASTAMAERLITCKIPSDSKYGSDHHPVLSSFNLKTIEQVVEPRRQFKETNVKVFCEVMLKDSAGISDLPLHSTSNIDKFLEALISAINKSIIASTPLCRITARSKPGFNAECKAAQMRARHLRKRFNRLGTDNAWEDYRLA